MPRSSVYTVEEAYEPDARARSAGDLARLQADQQAVLQRLPPDAARQRLRLLWVVRPCDRGVHRRPDRSRQRISPSCEGWVHDHGLPMGRSVDRVPHGDASGRSCPDPAPLPTAALCTATRDGARAEGHGPCGARSDPLGASHAARERPDLEPIASAHYMGLTGSVRLGIVSERGATRRLQRPNRRVPVSRDSGPVHLGLPARCCRGPANPRRPGGS